MSQRVLYVDARAVGENEGGGWGDAFVDLQDTLGVVELGDESARVEHLRVEYDVDRAIHGIRESDLPDDFAEFLRTGNRP